ncbi:putative molybdenum carrier protein [Thiolapillus sp.]
MPNIEKIVSGGQTGVDRGALDAALELGLPCGGWCPKGRRALDGPIPDRYPLQETNSRDYKVRTRLNVRDSDGTLILNCGDLSGGTAYTQAVAERLGRPCLVINLDDDAPDIRKAQAWVETEAVRVLNVAGPRENKCPGIQRMARAFVLDLLTPI